MHIFAANIRIGSVKIDSSEKMRMMLDLDCESNVSLIGKVMIKSFVRQLR